MDKDGFNRPCIQPGITLPEDVSRQIAWSCPGLNVKPVQEDGVNRGVWGRLISLTTGYASDDSLRFNGATGGALSALQKYLLENGRVDAIVSVSSDPENPLLCAVSSFSDPTEVERRTGSRYAPSSPLQDIMAEIKKYNSFAFVGKPCDVSALRRAATLIPELKNKVRYYLSFFCAGVPSQNATSKMLEKMGLDDKNVVSLKYRGNGWPGFASAMDRQGKEVRMSYNDSWGKILGHRVLGRCKICPDGIGEHADITCADAWHCDEKGFPDFREAAGVNAIAVRTSAGAELFRDAVRDGYITIQDSDLSGSVLEKMQPYQAYRKKVLITRTLACFVTRGTFIRFKVWPALVNAIKINPLRHVREFMGTTYRVLKGRL